MYVVKVEDLDFLGAYLADLFINNPPNIKMVRFNVLVIFQGFTINLKVWIFN